MAVVGHLKYLYFARIVLESYVIQCFLLCANVVLELDEGQSRHVAAGHSTAPVVVHVVINYCVISLFSTNGHLSDSVIRLKRCSQLMR